MPCLGEGRGRGESGEGGPARSGAQDKPTFLSTPGVVLAGAKQLNLHSAYMAATWLRHSNCTSVPRCEEHTGTPVQPAKLMALKETGFRHLPNGAFTTRPVSPSVMVLPGPLASLSPHLAPCASVHFALGSCRYLRP